MNENKQLIVPMNLAAKLARAFRKERVFFKRISKGNYQLVRRVYSKDELEVFSRFWPIEQIEFIVFEDVTIVTAVSDSMIVVDKELLLQQALEQAQAYQDKYWSEQRLVLFERMNAYNESIRRDSLFFYSAASYGYDKKSLLNPFWPIDI